MGQRIFECVLSIGTRSAQSIMASGLIAAQTGRTHDRTRPMLQLGQKVLAKASDLVVSHFSLAAQSQNVRLLGLGEVSRAAGT